MRFFDKKLKSLFSQKKNVEFKPKQDVKITIADGKKVYYYDTTNVPSPRLLHNIYKKIPDSKKIPIVIQTKKQYLDEYISNQELAGGKKFTPQEKHQYKREELDRMKGIVSRYTTKTNKYIEPRVVFFSDRKWTPQQLKFSAQHEYAHELVEKKPELLDKYSENYTPDRAVTPYGATDVEEDFADRYAIRHVKDLRISGNNKFDNSRNYIRLGKSKVPFQFYVYPNKPNDIFVGGVNRIEQIKTMFNKPEDAEFFIRRLNESEKNIDIDSVAKGIAHEEIHNTLSKEVGPKASVKYDYITRPISSIGLAGKVNQSQSSAVPKLSNYAVMRTFSSNKHEKEQAKEDYRRYIELEKEDEDGSKDMAIYASPAEKEGVKRKIKEYDELIFNAKREGDNIGAEVWKKKRETFVDFLKQMGLEGEHAPVLGETLVGHTTSYDEYLRLQEEEQKRKEELKTKPYHLERGRTKDVVLQAITDADGLTRGEIINRTGISPSFLTNVLGQLEREGKLEPSSERGWHKHYYSKERGNPDLRAMVPAGTRVRATSLESEELTPRPQREKVEEPKTYREIVETKTRVKLTPEEKVERQKEYKRKYYQENKEKFKEYMKKYYESKKEKDSQIKEPEVEK